MAANKRLGKGANEPSIEVSQALPASDPPQPSRWQLVTSGMLVGLWIFFLAWMAFTG